MTRWLWLPRLRVRSVRLCAVVVAAVAFGVVSRTRRPAPPPPVGEVPAAAAVPAGDELTIPSRTRPTRKAAARAVVPADRPVDFNRDVRPILSEYCYACHGPAEEGRKADLRLDVPDDLARESDSGRQIVRAGHPTESELIARVVADGAGAMPPPKSGKKLTTAQVEVLRRWVSAGGKYTPHWAYAAPVAHAPPPVKDAVAVRTPIDSFLQARLEKSGLTLSPEADRPTLIRRLGLALTGLPPTPAEVDAFVADPASDAYERQVDRLLASPHYGERMAPAWLDLARYADTNGGTADNGREMWLYRDWVVQALNDNLPFDQFTVEQLAGDLLPNPTVGQKIATGFLRNEGARIEACSDNGAVLAHIDRANTVGTAWLGLTAGCAQCHDHKSDPLTQRDYYRMLAFFNNHPGGALPGVDARGNRTPVLTFPTPAQAARQARVRELLGAAEREIELLTAATEVPTAAGTAWAEDERKSPAADLPAPVRDALRADPVARTPKQTDDVRRHFIEFVYPPTQARFARLRAGRDRLTAELTAIDGEITSTMVMDQPAEQPDTHVLIRGELGKKGEKVAPGVPAFLPPLPAGAKPDRLAFARWLTRRDHPLTARVAVNRVWQGHFGVGLVPTGDDFGAQGEPPTHPELLDWLAVRFVESGWDVKALHKLIAMSAVFRQSGRVSVELADADPANALLGRWPRTRLPAETLRDNALAVGGLLNTKAGGPGVRPYQPEGLWEAIRHPGDLTSQVYEQSHGADLYRRGVYVFAKRTMPHPTLSLFDGADRDLCVGRRYRTNTALQALVLLNDTTAVECARGLAVRMYKNGGPPEQWLTHGFRLCTARHPKPSELDVLRRVFTAELDRFRADPAAAEALFRVGESPVSRDFPPADLAALTVVGNLLLNLDETLTLE